MTFEDLFHNLNQQTGQGAGAGAARPQRARKPRKAIGTPLTRTLLNLLVTLVVGAVYFYFALPALNPQAMASCSCCAWYTWPAPW